ncbi:MAG: metallophosphoesterase [Methanobacteriota archaeon]|nr:MAG: metallophosphoesterase [Euryarchaeota archaeon]
MTDEHVVYAIADTHLGLREKTRYSHNDEPQVVGEFLRWLIALSGKDGETLLTLEANAIVPRPLSPASHLVLLGDILELWDAENQAILLSSIPQTAILENLEAEKIYILGNHDNILETLAGSYPLGTPEMNVVKEVYPEPDEDTGIVLPLRIGTQSFIFIHGHQLDRFSSVTIHASQVLGTFRQLGAALGSYAWLIFGFWWAALLAQWFGGAPLWGWVLLLVLALLWIPRLYMTVARPIYRKAVGRRYKRNGALEGFVSWWKRFRKLLAKTGDLGVVYGHTHIIDWFETDPQRERGPELVGTEKKLSDIFERLGWTRQALYNVSSWVSAKGKHEKEIMATIFYADERGPLLLGWDWKSKHPFHIPFEFIRKRWKGQVLDESEISIAERLGWPPKFVEKWLTRAEKV